MSRRIRRWRRQFPLVRTQTQRLPNQEQRVLSGLACLDSSKYPLDTITQICRPAMSLTGPLGHQLCGSAQISPQCRSDAPPHKRVLRFPFRSRIHLDKIPDASRFERRYWNSIAIENAIRCECRHSIARRDDANKIQGVSRADAGQRAFTGTPPNCSKHADCFEKGELVAGETRHETASSNFAASLQSMIRSKQIAPRERQAFTIEQSLKHHSVAAQRCRDRKNDY